MVDHKFAIVGKRGKDPGVGCAPGAAVDYDRRFQNKFKTLV